MRAPVVRTAVVLILAALAPATFRAYQADEPVLTRDEMREFLLTARVVGDRRTSTGITRPYRLTLTDGRITHDAAFQSIDEREPIRKFENGRVEINFVDSFRYDLAASTLAGLLGLEDMMPVTVQRRWNGRMGALSWWLPVQMDERERIAKKIEAPDSAAWNAQMHRVRVFSALVADSDRNLTNILISKDWHIWMIDFTRAFRLFDTLRRETETDLIRCDRALLERLRGLDRDAVAGATEGQLQKGELDALMARRDRIVAHFDALVAAKGEADVLY